MLIFILLLVVGSLLAYISQFNLMPVTVDFGAFSLTDIPLFYVIIGSLVLGLVLSYIAHLIDSISTLFTIRGKDHEIKKNKAKQLELTKRIHQLELENEKQKNSPLDHPDDEHAL